MNDGFYRAFEDRHRGSRDLIKERLEAYLPFIRPLGHLYPGATAIDLGCGRGEFLEVLESVGLSAAGVDLDAGMLDACRERGLAVQQDDALAYLASLTDESQAVVSAFHLVEHISFDQLRQLVSEALRVLLPGGLLIMETPNPENIIVATRNFYLDPTHQHPIPPLLLSFVADFAGFKRVKTIRLQESTDLAGKAEVSLHDVLQGVSPDYAVIAQKNAEQSILSSTNEPFECEYGLTIETLTARHDSTWRLEVHRVEAMVKALEIQAQELERVGQQTLGQLKAIYASKSWRITAPLRWAGSAMRGFTTSAMRLHAKVFLQRAAHFVGRHPRLKNAALKILNRFPRVKSRLFHVITGIKIQSVRLQNVPIEVANLSPRARQIHADLKAAIKRRQKERI